MVLCCVYQGSASVVSGTPSILLSSMSTDVVCERVKLIDGMDQNMFSQYTATIKKVCIYEPKNCTLRRKYQTVLDYIMIL